jgi:hypothetical protein
MRFDVGVGLTMMTALMAQVTLEIIGIYFKQTLDLSKTPKEKSVKEVMDLFIDKVGNSTSSGGFDYMTDASYNPMKLIRHNFPGGTSRSGKRRMAGMYELEEVESPDRKIVYAWQYYVLNEKSESVSATPQGEPFTSFINARYEFKDGWRIIWRQVAIVRRPNSAPLA